MTRRQLIQAYIVEQEIERTRRYLIDGREFADYSDEALTEHFIWTFRDVAATGPGNAFGWSRLLDLKCEFDLRRTKLPLHAVAAEYARYREHLERRWREGRHDPAACEHCRAELAELRERLSRPKN
jgi:hypothetical protein